ncbi:hypothetical protein [Rhizobium arsenicireducens]
MPNTTKTPPAASAEQFYKAHGVPEDIKSRLESTAILLISATRRSTEETFELGEHLEKAATLLPEGTVEQWAAERCGYTARHIRTLRATARNLVAYKEVLVEFAVGPTVVGKLSSASPEQIEQAIGVARETGRLRVQDVTAIISGSKEGAEQEEVDPFDVGGPDGLKAIVALKVREGMKSFITHVNEIRSHVEEALPKQNIVKKALVEKTAMTARLARAELKSLAQFVTPHPEAANHINSTMIPDRTKWAAVGDLLYNMGSEETWPDKAGLRAWLENEVLPNLNWVSPKPPESKALKVKAASVDVAPAKMAKPVKGSKPEAETFPTLKEGLESMFAGFGIDARVNLTAPERKNTIPTLSEALAKPQTRGPRPVVRGDAKLESAPAA